MTISREPLDVSQTNIEQKKRILELATDVRKFEIERFWQRSIFFWGFIAAAFVAYAQSACAQSACKGDLAFLVACFGLVCSIAWTLQNRGSKYWYEAWEAKVESVEKDVLGVHLFTNREAILRKGPWGARAFSVTKLAIALSDFTALTWLALAVRAFPPDKIPTVPDFPVIAGLVTIAYIALLFTCRQS